MNKYIIISLLFCLYYTAPGYAFNSCINQQGKKIITDRPCEELGLGNPDKTVESSSSLTSSKQNIRPHLNNKSINTIKNKTLSSLSNPSSRSTDDILDRHIQIEEALKNLLLSLSREDKNLFRKQLLPSRVDFVERRNYKGLPDDQKKVLYERVLNTLEDKWEAILNAGHQLNISWPDVEYLSFGGLIDPDFAKVTMGFRANHENFAVLVQLSRIHGRWLVMKLADLKRHNDFVKKPKLKVTALSKRYSFSKDVPEQGYKAVYFDLNTGEPGCSEHLDEINVNLGDVSHKQFVEKGSLFCGIPIKDLGAYFVGNIHIDKATEKALSPQYSHWAKVQVDIDDMPIFTKWAGDRSYNFTQGIHKIEALYQPHLNPLMWTEFSFWVVDQLPVYSRNELKAALPALGDRNTSLWYAAVYENKASTLKPVWVELQTSTRPVILLLNSVRARQFVIANAEKAKLRAIVYSGASTSEFTIQGTDDVPIYNLMSAHSLPWISTLEGFDSETGTSPSRLLQSINWLSPDNFLSGFSSKYDTDILYVPERHLSRDEYQALHEKFTP